MNITRDVITDLWPVYESGEASAETRALVEAFLQQDPEFARVLRQSASQDPLKPVAPRLSPDHEAKTFSRTKKAMQGYNWLLFFAMLWSGFAFGRIISDTSFDVSPINFVITATIAIAFWIAFFTRMLAAQRKVLMNTPLLGTFCFIGGVVYLLAGIRLILTGTPTDPFDIELTHLFKLMWAGGGICGLMGMFVTRATGEGRVARAMIGLPAIGLLPIAVEALIALIAHNPTPSFPNHATPLSIIGQFLIYIGMLIVGILVLRAKHWTGWIRWTPLTIFLASSGGLLLDSLLKVGFLELITAGVSWALIGFAVQTQQTADFQKSFFRKTER
jgi:hypothetical protein